MGRGWGGPDPRKLVHVLPASGAAADRGSGTPLLPADAGPLPHAGAVPRTADISTVADPVIK